MLPEQWSDISFPSKAPSLVVCGKDQSRVPNPLKMHHGICCVLLALPNVEFLGKMFLRMHHNSDQILQMPLPLKNLTIGNMVMLKEDSFVPATC